MIIKIAKFYVVVVELVWHDIFWTFLSKMKGLPYSDSLNPYSIPIPIPYSVYTCLIFMIRFIS